MKEWLLKMIKEKEEARAALKAKGKASTSIDEVRALGNQVEVLDKELAEFRNQLEALPDEAPPATTGASAPAHPQPQTVEQPPEFDQRQVQIPQGQLNVLATYGIVRSHVPEEPEKKNKEAAELAEKRGQALKEMRSVTVGTSNIILPAYQASDIKPYFNEVSSIIDRVNQKPLPGGESFRQPYEAGAGQGDYTTEGNDYANADQTFDYADITKAKIAAYSEDSEEVTRLPAADYDAAIMKSVPKSVRKKITKEILVGTGAANHLAGIFSAAATAINAATDLSISEIDETTLDEILYTFGGDEDVEDVAVLVLNKLDLKAFATLRDADGEKIYTVVNKGNTGTIDNVPFIINSACKAISSGSSNEGDYAMAYGPLSNYTLAIFSDLEVQRSLDYKFKQGMIAHRGSIFCGGNVTAKNGFLRVKKG
ncbi:MAG TPA: phage major capsid protein [Desulfitobacteriaceae bacterium]|nr:phage major capsid protein [Desulfitobacteriaceae bacterium]